MRSLRGLAVAVVLLLLVGCSVTTGDERSAPAAASSDTGSALRTMLEAERGTAPAAAAAPDTGETAGAATQAAPTRTGRAPVAEAAIEPQVLTVIAAAVAAYLGERAHVKQVRLIGSHEWGRQGRVNVQASHALHR